MDVFNGDKVNRSTVPPDVGSKERSGAALVEIERVNGGSASSNMRKSLEVPKGKNLLQGARKMVL